MAVKMKFIYQLALLSLLLFGLSGCANFYLAVPVKTVLGYQTGSLPSSTKLFLVASSAASANFAQEIIDQKDVWIQLGIKEAEIACYYNIPGQAVFERDQNQFIEIGPKLSRCYQANIELLKTHLQQIAKVSPPYVYLYMTAHGNPPISQVPEKHRLTGFTKKARSEILKKNFEFLEQFNLTVDSYYEKANTPENNIPWQFRVGGCDFREPDCTSNYLLSPSSLKNMLQSLNKIPKFIVLQGCFSGGFIEDSRPNAQERTLSTLPKVTVITASRFDRASFGCNPGSRTTYFGQAFNETLQEQKTTTSPLSLNWKETFSTIKQKIVALESPQKFTPSEPQLFTSQ